MDAAAVTIFGIAIVIVGAIALRELGRRTLARESAGVDRRPATE